MTYTVYTLTFDNLLYIGQTNKLTVRYNQHKLALTNPKLQKRKFYSELNKLTPLLDKKSKWDFFIKNVKLSSVKEFSTRRDAKLFEAYLILQRYFNGDILYQKLPRISDR